MSSRLPDIARCIGGLAATAVQVQRELAVPALPGLEAFGPPALALSRLTVSMTAQVETTRSAGGRVGLAVGPLNAYAALAYGRSERQASRIEIVVERVPAPPAQP